MNANDAGTLIRTFEGMPWHDEGYVVVDANFNRVKLKNPAYVAVHHLKGKSAEHNIMEIVKSNEIEEFAATFPERRLEIFELKDKYDKLTIKLDVLWNIIKEFKPKNITKKEQKKYAMKVFEVTKEHGVENFSNLYFMLNTYKVNSVKEFMNIRDNKSLYKEL
jgi:hypothetical protein